MQWVRVMLPELPDSRFVLDGEGRAHWLQLAGFVDLRHVAEQADGTLASETVPDSSPDGPPSADLAFAPDGTLWIATDTSATDGVFLALRRK